MEDKGLRLEDIFFDVSRQLIAVYVHVQVIAWNTRTHRSQLQPPPPTSPPPPIFTVCLQRHHQELAALAPHAVAGNGGGGKGRHVSGYCGGGGALH